MTNSKSENESEIYKQRVLKIHRELGIPEDYAETCGIATQMECVQLVKTELDVFGRQPSLEADAYAAWQKMKFDAGKAGIELQIVSAYRSVDYQKQILLKKIERGEALSDILKVNAAPGYSEHHTGQALDIGCPNFEHLHENFEKSPAFAWLCEQAENYGFSLSFPRNNVYGYLYEPWHWKFSK